MTVLIRGTTPLCSNRFAACRRGPSGKSPSEQIEESLYRIQTKKGEKKRYGFPTAAFKSAIVDACFFVKGSGKSLIRSNLSVRPATKDGLVEIFGEISTFNERVIWRQK